MWESTERGGHPHPHPHHRRRRGLYSLAGRWGSCVCLDWRFSGLSVGGWADCKAMAAPWARGPKGTSWRSRPVTPCLWLTSCSDPQRPLGVTRAHITCTNTLVPTQWPHCSHNYEIDCHVVQYSSHFLTLGIFRLSHWAHSSIQYVTTCQPQGIPTSSIHTGSEGAARTSSCSTYIVNVVLFLRLGCSLGCVSGESCRSGLFDGFPACETLLNLSELHRSQMMVKTPHRLMHYVFMVIVNGLYSESTFLSYTPQLVIIHSDGRCQPAICHLPIRRSSQTHSDTGGTAVWSNSR